MAYNSRLLPRDTGPGKSSSIQTYLTCCQNLSGLQVFGFPASIRISCNHSDSINKVGNTVGAVVSTTHAFRLADYTADRDSHPALKLCRRKGI